MEAKKARCGTVARYKRGCRCDDCKRAHAYDAQDRRNKRARKLAADPSIAEHGSLSTYANYRCRCDPCATTRKSYQRSMIKG